MQTKTKQTTKQANNDKQRIKTMSVGIRNQGNKEDSREELPKQKKKKHIQSFQSYVSYKKPRIWSDLQKKKKRNK